jgi:hypothetical protein
LLPSAIRRFFKPSLTGPYRSPAFQTLLILRGDPILAAKELLFAHCQLLIELQQEVSQSPAFNGDEEMDFSLESRTSWWARVEHVLPLPLLPRKSCFAYIRREAIAAGWVMLSQQLCGKLRHIQTILDTH